MIQERESRTDPFYALPRISPAKLSGIFLLLMALVFPFVLSLGMNRGLSHDEHQHVAAGALLARKGMLPYVDYPYFHTPYLVFIYGGLFRLTDYLLLAGRLVTVVCATAIVALVGTAGYWEMRDRGRRSAVSFCVIAVLACLTSAVFIRTTGRAWNHEPALLFALASFLIHLAALRQGRILWLIASGVFLGVAIGLRITYAPLAAPFIIAIFIEPALRSGWVGQLLGFTFGLGLGCAGLLWLFIAAREQAFFGNFEFAKVNITYLFATGEPRTMTLFKKFRYLAMMVGKPDAGIVLAFLLSMGAALLTRQGLPRWLTLELRFLMLSLPFLLLGCMAPSPLFHQYFYPLAPFLILGTVYALAVIPSDSLWFRRALVACGAAGCLTVGLGARTYSDIGALFLTRNWRSIEIHAESQDLRALVPAGKILTLAPIYALEGGCSIYPGFATGPFAWRISPFVDARKAQRLQMTTAETLPALLQADPPAAVSLGFEKRGEEQFKDYARSHGYRLIPRVHKGQLWVRQETPLSQ